jgi:hypothetical protein
MSESGGDIAEPGGEAKADEGQRRRNPDGAAWIAHYEAIVADA